MKCVSFYHRETGLFNGAHLTTSDEDTIELNTPADHVAIDGHHDSLSKRVDISSGEVVDYQAPPLSDDHVLDPQTRQWVLTPAALERKRKRPDALARIAKLEAAQHRLVREALMQLMLGQDTKQSYQRLAGIDDEIETLRSVVNENL